MNAMKTHALPKSRTVTTRTCSCGKTSATGGCAECRKKREQQTLVAHASGERPDVGTRLPPRGPMPRLDALRVYPASSSLVTGEEMPGITQTATPATVQTQTQAVGGGSSGGSTHHCAPSGSFVSIPSGNVAPTFSGGGFSAPFSMHADFARPPIPCTGVCGEYRQYVRGFFKHNGTTLTHRLCANTLDPTTWHEDCATIGGTDYKYGYHSLRFATSKFEDPDQATGRKYRGEDAPGFGRLNTGDTVEMNLEFRGELVDACDSGRVLRSTTWTVKGSGTAP